MLHKRLSIILGCAIFSAALSYWYFKPLEAPASSTQDNNAPVSPKADEDSAEQSEKTRQKECLAAKKSLEQKTTEEPWIKKARESKTQPVLLAVVWKECGHCHEWEKHVYRQYGDECSLAFYHDAIGGELPLPDIQKIEIIDHQDWAKKLNIRQTPYFIVNNQKVDFEKDNPSDQVMKDKFSFHRYGSSKLFYKDLAQQASFFYRNMDA